MEPAELAEPLARDGVAPRRGIGQRPGQGQAKPAGPVRAPRHGRDVPLRVLGDQVLA